MSVHQRAASEEENLNNQADGRPIIIRHPLYPIIPVFFFPIGSWQKVVLVASGYVWFWHDGLLLNNYDLVKAAAGYPSSQQQSPTLRTPSPYAVILWGINHLAACWLDKITSIKKEEILYYNWKTITLDTNLPSLPAVFVKITICWLHTECLTHYHNILYSIALDH